MNKLLLFALSLSMPSVAMATPVVHNAVTIGFDGYSDPTYFSNSFSATGAVFTATGDTTVFEISTFGKTWGTLSPEILCPRTADIHCGGDFNVTFPSPVSALKFYFTGDDGTSALSVQALLNGILLGTVSVNGDGIPNTAQLVDLSSFGNIDEIKITGGAADPNGLGYDDFSFIAVPEASSWAMMLLGFAAIGTAARRRRFKASPVTA